MQAISNKEIKLIRSLSAKKFRDENGLFVVEGEKMVSEALASDFEVLKVFRKEEIGEDAMTKISLQSSPSPVLAIVRQPEGISCKQVKAPQKGLFLALDSLRDPGNLGTILRVADWFGVDGVYASEDSVDIFNPKVVQATMGAVFRVDFHYCPVAELAKSVLGAGGKVFGTFLDGRNIYERELSCGEQSPSVIVIGNESRGISAPVASLVSDRLFIPPYPADEPGSESLNAAVACALTVAEFRRRCL